MFKHRLYSLLLLLNVVFLLSMGVMAIYSTTYTTDATLENRNRMPTSSLKTYLSVGETTKVFLMLVL